MRLQIQIIFVSYAFLLLIFLLAKKDKKPYNSIFSIFIAALLISTLCDILTGLRLLTDELNFNTFISYLYGPLLLLYVRAITNISNKAPYITYLHFLPSLIVLVFEISVYGFINIGEFPLWKITSGLVIFHALLYLIKIVHLVEEGQLDKSNEHLRHWLRLLYWGFGVLLFMFSIELLLVFFEKYATYFKFNTFSLFLQVLFINCMVYLGLSTSEIFNKKEKYGYTNLSKSQKDCIVAKLINFMNNEEPYLSFDISLKTLSKQTNIERTQLSQVINEHFKQNFKEFINSYRIEKAKKLLVESNNLIIKEVMYKSGFHSKSTFNLAFEKNTGMNPSAFRKSMKTKK